MNTSKPASIVSCVILVMLVLGACGTLSPETPVSVTPTMNSTAQSLALTIVAQTMAAMPTSTVPPTQTAPVPTLTTTSTPASTVTPLPVQVLDGLRVAYTIDGNLYVQDSGEDAVQLTESGQDHSPVFSDDGRKIAFFREWETEMAELHLIDADGTGGRALVTSESLIALGLGYDEFNEPHSVAFVPRTHLLLMNTNHFSTNYPKADGSYGNPSNDLLLVDTETGEIKQLAPIGQGGYFLASPNGKWVAVQPPDHVDVIDLQGQVILRNLFSHSPDDYDCVFYGYICAPMYWKEDSSELILVQPIPLSERPTNGAGPLIRTVWKYSLDGRPGKEVRLTYANPMGEALSVSPDGNWIVFSLFDIGDQDGVYLGDLRSGTSQLMYKPVLNEVTGSLEPAPTSYDGWSPDSTHFVFGDSYKTFLGNIQGEVTPLGGINILGWVDNSHYFTGGTLGDINSKEKVLVIDFPPGVDRSETPIAFVFLGH